MASAIGVTIPLVFVDKNEKKITTGSVSSSGEMTINSSLSWPDVVALLQNKLRGGYRVSKISIDGDVKWKVGDYSMTHLNALLIHQLGATGSSLDVTVIADHEYNTSIITSAPKSRSGLRSSIGDLSNAYEFESAEYYHDP
jgi:hypothetical protein